MTKSIFSRSRAGMPGYHRQMLICMACAAFLCLLVFAFLAWQLRLGGLAAFDGTVTGWVRSFVNPGLTPWMILITDLGIFGFVTALTTLATILLFVRRQWMDGLGVTAAPLSAWWLELYLKSIFQRPRPGLPQLDAAPGYSFPSGHAIVTTALLFTLALVYYRHTNSRTGRMLALTVSVPAGAAGGNQPGLPGGALPQRCGSRLGVGRIAGCGDCLPDPPGFQEESGTRVVGLLLLAHPQRLGRDLQQFIVADELQALLQAHLPGGVSLIPRSAVELRMLVRRFFLQTLMARSPVRACSPTIIPA